VFDRITRIIRERVASVRFVVTVHAEEEMTDDDLTVCDDTWMTCDVCGREGARAESVTRSYGKGKGLLVIENVPVVVCPHCGESYLTAGTIREIERCRRNRRTCARRRLVSVANVAGRDQCF
jgi:YgiT-type zinc finger domain-containing protein